MATKPSSTAERADDVEKTLERERDLSAIDELIWQCKDRMSGVSDAVLSSATKSATLDMYRTVIRAEAERDELRAERLRWMKENVVRLGETIAKATADRARFESDLSRAVDAKWMSKESAGRWMRRFEDPSQLEMYRSAWLKNEWEGYKQRWETLARDRQKTRERCKARGLTAKDIPELAALESDEAFLSDKLSYHTRRSMVDTVNAAIDAAGGGKLLELRKAEALLLPATKGADRYLHPGKVGQWLQRATKSGDVAAFRDTVMKPFMANWKKARVRYDALAERYERDGRPDGCAPMSLNAFLESSYDDRLVALDEWQNRLDAAERMTLGANDALERAKLSIRRALDLKDVDVAAAKLDALRAEHPDDADVRSMAAYVETLRAEEAEKDDVDQNARTEEALRELRAMPDGVPSVLATHYKDLIERGDADQAAAFFLSMRARTDRRKAGKTDDADERMAAETADDIEEATVVTERTDGDADDTELVVTKDTPPSETFALIKAHAAARVNRAPALVIEGLPYEQQLQMVELNARALSHMRHLDSVGEGYKGAEKAETAIAA